MRRMVTILVVVICLIPFSWVFCQDRLIEGEISAMGGYVGVSGGEGGEAKFTEYKDLREPGVLYLRGRLNLDTPDYFLRFDMREPGYDTQYYNLEGGMYGKFKYELFYKEIPHNITFDARTFFLGAGHDTLIGTPNLFFGGWNTFDYSYERRQYGGGVKLNLIRPFFFDVSFQREEREGIKPTGAAGTSPGGIAIELPEPVDYLTNNLKVQTGYAKNPLFLSLIYLYSQFNNSNSVLNFVNPATGAFDIFSLPPDNTYHKGAFRGALKLPFHSRLSTNVGFSRGNSETTAFPTVTGGRTDFDGKVSTFNYDVVLTSNPIPFLDAKVFTKYYKRNNRSDEVPQVGLVSFLDYKVMNYGGEIGFKLPARFYLRGGYQYVKTEREFHEAPNNLPFSRDNIFSVDLKWSGLDFMDFRVGYERLDRETSQDPGLRNKMYSYAAQDRDSVKLSVDIFPFENLSFGVEYRHRKADYTDTIFGLRGDRRDEIGSNVTYTLAKIAKLYGNVDFGLIEFTPDLVRSTAGTDSPWKADQRDKTFAYGLGAEIYVIPNKLTLVFQHDYLRSNGRVDFTIDPALFTAANGLAGANQDNVDLMKSEDYTLYSFGIKAIYDFTKSLSACLGYRYERFNYSDDQLNGYVFVPAGGVGSNGAFLTGAYKSQSYTGHLVFAGVTYKF